MHVGNGVSLHNQAGYIENKADPYGTNNALNVEEELASRTRKVMYLYTLALFLVRSDLHVYAPSRPKDEPPPSEGLANLGMLYR